jgi:hypothetical protein
MTRVAIDNVPTFVRPAQVEQAITEATGLRERARAQAEAVAAAQRTIDEREDVGPAETAIGTNADTWTVELADQAERAHEQRRAALAACKARSPGSRTRLRRRHCSRGRRRRPFRPARAGDAPCRALVEAPDGEREPLGRDGSSAASTRYSRRRRRRHPSDGRD